jgi:hypothetical protein
VLDSDDENEAQDPIEEVDMDVALTPARKRAALGDAGGKSPGSGGRRAQLPATIAQAHAIAQAKNPTGRFQWEVPDVAMLLKGINEFGSACLCTLIEAAHSAVSTPHPLHQRHTTCMRR